jgi:hypothetical protein
MNSRSPPTMRAIAFLSEARAWVSSFSLCSDGFGAVRCCAQTATTARVRHFPSTLSNRPPPRAYLLGKLQMQESGTCQRWLEHFWKICRPPHYRAAGPGCRRDGAAHVGIQPRRGNGQDGKMEAKMAEAIRRRWATTPSMFTVLMATTRRWPNMNLRGKHSPNQDSAYTWKVEVRRTATQRSTSEVSHDFTHHTPRGPADIHTTLKSLIDLTGP